MADTLLLMMFLGRANARDTKMNVVFPCFANWETFVADTKFVSATNVARAGKRGNICVGNNVSATMCPRLPAPLGLMRIKTFGGALVLDFRKR